MLLHTFHVHLQSGQEHNIVETYPTKKFERVVADQNIKTILTDGDTRQNHANDMRNSKFTHHDRSKQNDHQHHKKDKSWVCNRQI